MTHTADRFTADDLTQAQVDEYRRNGFIQLDDVYVGDELAQLREAVVAAVEAEKRASPADPNRTPTPYEQIFVQKTNLWAKYPDVATFATDRRLGNIAARLEGLPMRLWHDQALFKEPGKGNNKTPWHQDAIYWPHVDRWRQTTVWIALEDATLQNGCMSFVNGTHTLGPLEPIDLANPEDLFLQARHLKPVRPEPRPLRAGGVTFHNGLTFHYAGPNKSQSTREAFAIIYMPDGTRFDGAPHCVTETLGLTRGDVLAGDHFPRVSD